ncbi:MAG TPA: hypothetical protein VN778_04800 [Verrucomicrobiae bacterium]|nr:hypothetical protein [Verrucomicrobiae bacterium]
MYSYIALLALYAGFRLLPAPSPATLLLYHVSSTELRFIELTIILLSAGIWYAGFYGYDRLDTYTKYIKNDKDGQQVAWLTKGIFVLVMWLPVSSVISSVLQYIAMRHLGLLTAVTIIDNYISLLFPLVGFALIGVGARGLSTLVKRRFTYPAANILVIILIYIGLIYYHLVASTYHRSSIYHMSVWLILVTLVAPYMYMWYIGLTAAYEIYHYQKKVAGIVYRSSWNLLALGLGWLIVTSIGLQYLTTLSARLTKLSIYWILAIVYTLLIVLSIGFVLIALGAKKLQKIEEV